MPRIAVGGFQHETNTFAPQKAEWADFARGGGQPPHVAGPELLAVMRDMNLPIAGAIAELGALEAEAVPLTWCAAVPSAHVTDDAFERICALLLAELHRAGPVDGVYLCLHGAGVTESHEDAEGELLRRVRAVVGPDVPVVASLDLHANVTRAMAALSDGLVAYRTYPHVDMAETGARAARMLDAMVRSGRRPAKALRQVPFLIPLPWQCTLMEPTGGLYRLLEAVEAETGALLSFTPGFPAADIAECGAAVLAYADDPAVAQAACARLADAVEAAEGAFAGELLSAGEAAARAVRMSNEAARPVVLADTQDNPGGGGPSDTVHVLRALVDAGARGAVVGVVADGEVAAAAHAAGVGAEFEAALGGKSGMPGEAPYAGRFRVEALGDGRFTGTGPMWRGFPIDLGPMALLRVLDADADVRVVVSTRKMQAADRSIFRHLGVEPSEARILALKSSVHFRADFQPIAEAILVVEAPGPVVADPARLPWTRLRDGVRLRPHGPVMRRG
jgi:microcystin degradation protein MlrC